MRRIVVGLDPSDHARAAVRAACELARELHAGVTGVAVLDHGAIDHAEVASRAGAGAYAWRAHQFHLEHAEKILRQLLGWFDHEARTLSVPAENRFVSGKPVNVLTEAAIGAELLVLGTRTHFRFETSDRSDNTLENVLHERVVSTLAVPAWGWKPVRALIAYDGSIEAASALQRFIALTEGIASARDVTLLHVGHLAADDDVLREPERILSAHGRTVHVRVEHGEPGLTVMRIAQGLQPAWVVLGASKRGRLRQRLTGGVTRTLIDDGHIPFLAAV